MKPATHLLLGAKQSEIAGMPETLGTSPREHLEIAPEALIGVIQNYAKQILLNEGLAQEKIDSGDLRLSTILYMVYWHQRLEHNPHEQKQIFDDLVEYLGDTGSVAKRAAATLIANEDVRVGSKEYVSKLLVPSKTVDLVITRQGAYEDTPSDDRDILCIARTFYPYGNALPGGFIKDTDADNALKIPAPLFAALRVAGEKVLGLRDNAEYVQEPGEDGKQRYIVRGKDSSTPAVIIYADVGAGFHFRENIRSVFRPSDSRHIVDTVGFKCEIVGEPASSSYTWRKKGEVMSSDSPSGGLAFNHHREIIAHIGSRTSLERERTLEEHTFIRSIINDPLGMDRMFQRRFDLQGRDPNTSFPELFPVADRLLKRLYGEDINTLCKETPLLTGFRDQATIALRHCMLKNETFCPYLATNLAIRKAIDFLDVVARQKRELYAGMSKDEIVEHDPRTTPYAYYHSYRYQYRTDQLLGKIPEQNLILTFEELDATDLLKVRGSRNRFIGIWEDFTYVDEFFQSPKEGTHHDDNHTYRMILEDEAYMERHHLTPDEYYEKSSTFTNKYLEALQIRESDSEEQREMKKLKLIILFEIAHEDAKPLLPDVICDSIQQMEGKPVPFEGPHVDPHTHDIDIVKTMDTGIATLSYVRNKLQNGFYDQVDSQMPQIVDPKYRTSEWIAKAAYDMLVELNAVPTQDAELDGNGRVSEQWLLLRTVSVGPDNIHESTVVDPTLEKLRGEARALNPKRYQL